MSSMKMTVCWGKLRREHVGLEDSVLPRTLWPLLFHIWEAAFPTEEGLEVSVNYKEMTLAVEWDWEWKKGEMEALPSPVEDTGEYTSEPHAISLFHKQVQQLV